MVGSRRARVSAGSVNFVGRCLVCWYCGPRSTASRCSDDRAPSGRPRMGWVHTCSGVSVGGASSAGASGWGPTSGEAIERHGQDQEQWVVAKRRDVG